MSNYRLDRDRTLRDYRGTPIGKVDYWNRVRDGYRDRGQIDANDRYIDEYGRERGWTLPDYGGGEGGLGLAFLLVMGFVALMIWLISKLLEAIGVSKNGISSHYARINPSRARQTSVRFSSTKGISTLPGTKRVPTPIRSHARSLHPTSSRPLLPPKPRLN